MEFSDEYRTKLRTPKKEIKHELAWGTSTASFDTDFANYPLFMNTPSPLKRKHSAPTNRSPHKSGYFLRTSPLSKGNLFSPPKSHGNIKVEAPPGTPSPHKAGSSTDLFGNRSLLDNLPVPDWDDNFLDNFQEEFLFGLGSEDLEGLVKSPIKTPGRFQAFLSNSPLKDSLGLSPLKGPLLTSSPKVKDSSPRGLGKTPATNGGRPLTRQRKLFLQSPERQQRPLNTNVSLGPVPLLFSSVDSSSSSFFSDEGHETTTSIHSISSYLKQFDEEEVEEELPVMPPAGWTTKKTNDNSKLKGHGKGKSSVSKYGKSLSSKAHSQSSQPVVLQTQSHSTGGKKPRQEPQFTLLKPQTEILNNQICLRMAPRTPPNKIKISRDFSQIQTLPSKEQLKIVRTRFRETLDKAVEQIIEKEREKAVQKRSQTASSVGPSIESVTKAQSSVKCELPEQISVMTQLQAPLLQYSVFGHTAGKPQIKRKKR